ncbi:phage tail fibers [Yersinia enterocolitica]|nr:phage tail fibers [Yersinia enterocolitica]
MTDRLLPVGSSVLEVAAARACAELENTPVPIRQLWNADTCPLPLLPYLAWAYSVDRWDEKWPEATKRGGEVLAVRAQTQRHHWRNSSGG